MRRTIGLLATIIGVAAIPAVAQATTFSGTCDPIKGTAKFGSPLTSAQGPNTYDFKGTAKCTGKVDGKAVTDVPVTVAVAGPGNLSCSQGASTEDGDGTITIDATGQKVRFKMAFTSVASEVDITIKNLKGVKSGTGHASFADKDHPDANLQTLQNCGPGGAGNSTLSFTANATVADATPLDDGQAATSTAPSNTSTPSSSTETAPAPSNTGSSNQPAKKPKPKAKKKPKKKHKAKSKSKHKAKGKKKKH
jgi:hypothetical protein